MRSAQNKSYFYFTRKERNGILFLISLAVISVCVSIVYPYLIQKTSTSPISSYANEIANLEAKKGDTSSVRNRYKNRYKDPKRFSGAYLNRFDEKGGDLFYFDPNILSANDWKRLGLRDKTIGIIQNYLAKGGRFREVSDISKIWGLEERIAQRIMPYARIAHLERDVIKPYPKAEFTKSFSSKTYDFVNINEGDTSSLTKLPGIGPKLSQRIIKYRDRLGGFYSVDQIGETFGLPDSTFKKIRAWLKIEKDKIKTLNINTATLEELKTHPYIRYHLANALVNYRLQHKNYSSVTEIRNIMLVDDTTYQKIAPYLVVD